MRKPFRTLRRAAMAAAALACTICTAAMAQTPTAADLVGRTVTDFALPSTGDRLTRYEGDYYGKHNLILTFFPAAFTPV